MRLGEALAGGCAVTASAVIAVSPGAVRQAAAAEGPETPARPVGHDGGDPHTPGLGTELPPLGEARPPLPTFPEPAPLPWEHHFEIGAGLAVTETPISVDGDGKATPVRFRPAPGFHVDLSWQVFRYFRFTGYIVEHDHAILWGNNPLGLGGNLDSANAHMYTFGVRFSPTLPLGTRARLWLTAGAGWGRIEYGRLTFTQPNQSAIVLRERAESLFEIPMGVGGAVDLIPRWLSVHVEVTGAFVPSQIGEALEHGQFIDNAGMKHDLAPMPKLDASFVETIGLSLHL